MSGVTQPPLTAGGRARPAPLACEWTVASPLTKGSDTGPLCTQTSWDLDRTGAGKAFTCTGWTQNTTLQRTGHHTHMLGVGTQDKALQRGNSPLQRLVLVYKVEADALQFATRSPLVLRPPLDLPEDYRRAPVSQKTPLLLYCQDSVSCLT